MNPAIESSQDPTDSTLMERVRSGDLEQLSGLFERHHRRLYQFFLRLARVADIWMESSKPGTWARWGLDDATVLAANPRLVIAHVSGYGQTGDPDYVGRASYDMVGQAFGGLMDHTGFPDPEPPTPDPGGPLPFSPGFDIIMIPAPPPGSACRAICTDNSCMLPAALL